MHKAAQREMGVVLLGGGPAPGFDQCAQHLDGDPSVEIVAVRKPPVEGRDADPGAPGYLIQRGIGPLIGEDLAGGAQDLLPVAPRVGAHGRDVGEGVGVGVCGHGALLTAHTKAMWRNFLHIAVSVASRPALFNTR